MLYKLILFSEVCADHVIFFAFYLQTGEKVKDPDSCESSTSTMDTLQVDDGFHSDGGLTPPPSPSSSGSSSSILSTASDSVSLLISLRFLRF